MNRPFELVDVYKEDDITYYALIPQQSDPDNLEEDDYFVILKKTTMTVMSI